MPSLRRKLISLWPFMAIRDRKNNEDKVMIAIMSIRIDRVKNCFNSPIKYNPEIQYMNAVYRVRKFAMSKSLFVQSFLKKINGSNRREKLLKIKHLFMNMETGLKLGLQFPAHKHEI